MPELGQGRKFSEPFGRTSHSHSSSFEAAQLFLATNFEQNFPAYALAKPNGTGAEEMKRQQSINCVAKIWPWMDEMGNGAQ